jgi:ABC-type antimicrobial peptide transport system permease subunit
MGLVQCRWRCQCGEHHTSGADAWHWRRRLLRAFDARQLARRHAPGFYSGGARAWLSERQVLGKHALKNALIPLVTVLGLEFASLLSGLIFTEKIFAWPGIGSLVVDSVTNQDVPMIMGTVLFSSFVVVATSILVDIAYRLIDPRVRFE